MKYFYIILLFIYPQLGFALGDKPYSKAYDPARDPFVDFIAAQADAKAQDKLILLEFGGNWCVWCHRLDKFTAKQTDIAQGISEVFIVLKVNVSEENGNEKFLVQFSDIPGYPHFIIASSNGKEIEAVNTSKLEEGKSYSVQKVSEFIAAWRKNRLNGS